MTNEQIKAKQLAQLLNAFADGKQLQYKTDLFVWYDSNNIDYIIDSFISGRGVRIKPETRRIALNQQDLIDRIKEGKTMWVRHNNTDYIEQIRSFNQYYVGLPSRIDSIGYEQIMEYTFLDGTPCYKEVECE